MTALLFTLQRLTAALGTQLAAWLTLAKGCSFPDQW
jgi:hypothetical protein